MFKLQGEIEQEKLKGDYIQVKQKHKLMEADGDGEAEAMRATTFLQKTAPDVPDMDVRVSMWNTLRKQDALSVVSSGPAKLFFTPNDCNLAIDVKEVISGKAGAPNM